MTAMAKKDEAKLEVPISNLTVINGTTRSCLAQKMNFKDPDIGASYFVVPKLKVSQTTNEKLVVDNVLLEVDTAQKQVYACLYNGSNLDATDLPAEIEPHSSGETDCPIICGGFLPPRAGTYTVTMSVYGYFEKSDGSTRDIELQTKLNVTVPAALKK
jgi:hypothetical protein